MLPYRAAVCRSVLNAECFRHEFGEINNGNGGFFTHAVFNKVISAKRTCSHDFVRTVNACAPVNLPAPFCRCIRVIHDGLPAAAFVSFRENAGFGSECGNEFFDELRIFRIIKLNDFCRAQQHTAVICRNTYFNFSEVVGKPVVIDDKTTVIPLSKVSVGYVGGQGNALKNDKKASDVDAGGFGMSVTPVGILIAGEKTTYVGVDKNYTEDKWINLLKTVADTVIK